MRRVLFLFSTAWDRKRIEKREAWTERFELVLAEPSDEDCPARIDVSDYVERIAREHRGRVQGVISSSDYPGPMLVALVAEALGLPGTQPLDAARASHKFHARLAQRIAAPEATPRFELIDPRRPRAPGFGFPCFVKPVKASFSRFAKRIENEDELHAHLDRPQVHEYLEHYLAIFNDVAARVGLEHDGRWFVAEELLGGQQVTLEGFVLRGEVEVLGIVDTIFHEHHPSFARFDLPSRLPEAVQGRMRDIARRVVRELRLEATAFNMELYYDAANDRIGIIELNPRLAGQFGDLYAKVDGVHGYEVALEVACGTQPQLGRSAGRYRASASVPLRVFDAVRVARAPSAGDVRAAEELFPETLVWSEVEAGQDLEPLRALEDGVSVRYGVVNLGGLDSADIQRRAAQVRERLGFRFEPS